MRHLQIFQWRYMIYLMAIIGLVLLFKALRHQDWTLLIMAIVMLVLVALRFYYDSRGAQEYTVQF